LRLARKGLVRSFTREEKVMRFTALAAAAVLAVSIATPSFAAKAQKPDAFAKDQASNPQSFDACVALAKQRGYNSADRDMGNKDSPVKRFVEGCMAGKQQ
jgi:hypothetical protein